MIDKYKITLEEVITYQHFYEALEKCNDDVSYKYSVQEYDINCIDHIHDSIERILNGEIPYVQKALKIVIRERGKERIITPIYIGDRVIQKVLCDYVLIPSIMPHLIYDNGASIKDRGVDFARQRVNGFIEDAKRHYDVTNIYAFQFDVKGYFDSIPHSLCYDTLMKYIYDERIVKLIIGIIESYQYAEIQTIEVESEKELAIDDLFAHKCNGICLGSQISQIMAGAVLNDFDHFIKDVCRVKYYERYMDDGLIICKDKEAAKKIKEQAEQYINSLGLSFHNKKTRIVKISKGFKFLKIHYNVTKDSKTVKRLDHDSMVRERRKLKSFRKKVDAGEMTLDDVYNNVQSWLAHAKSAKNNYHSIKRMMELYDELFGGYKITRKYYKEHPEERRTKKLTIF